MITGLTPEVRGATRHSFLARGRSTGLIGVLLASALLTAAAAAPADRLTRFEGPTPAAFSLDAVGGGRVTLADMRGRVVLVHFFATWCEPCRAELASLNRLNADLGPRGLAILAIDVAEVEARLARFLETAPVTFLVGLDLDRRVTRAWSVEALPTTVVLDRSAAPRLFVEGDADWSATGVRASLDALLDPPDPPSPHHATRDEP